MVTVEVDPTSAERVTASIGNVSAAVRAKVRSSITRSAIELSNFIKADALSGQILKNRTGNLRRSVHTEPTVDSGLEISAVVGVGNEAWYGKLHEYGVPHSWEIRPVKAKVLAWTDGSGTHFAKKVTHPGLLDRSFMRSSLAEKAPSIIAGLEAAVAEGIK